MLRHAPVERSTLRVVSWLGTTGTRCTAYDVAAADAIAVIRQMLIEALDHSPAHCRRCARAIDGVQVPEVQTLPELQQYADAVAAAVRAEFVEKRDDEERWLAALDFDLSYSHTPDRFAAK